MGIEIGGGRGTWWVGAALLWWAASVPAFGVPAVSGPAAGHEVQHLRDLPLEAQFAVSAALGREEAAYHALAAAGGVGFSAGNPAQGFEAELSASGFTVSTGRTRWGLALEGWGCDAGVERVAPAVPEASANRVELRRGALVEWYENGPLGLQQGFTLEEAPAGCDPREPVRLVLAPAADLDLAVDPDGRGLSVLGAGGRAVLRYRGLAAFDAGGDEVPAGLQLRGDRVVVEVATGGRYPVVVDPFVETAKLTASDGESFDRLGIRVASSGDTVVVGALGDDDNGTDSGAVYVFDEPSGGWASGTETAKLTASDGEPSHFFGGSVSVSGDTVVVGAIGDGDNGFRSGAAYVFVEPAGGWVSGTETAKLTASDAAEDHRFGDSVSVSGDTVMVGARDDDNGRFSGSVYVFVEPAGGWASGTETAKLTASDGEENDTFGSSVALSGDTVVVGADGDDDGGSASGAAYVFVEPPGGWASGTETAKLTASDAAAFDRFGDAVALSGDTVVVGADDDDDGGDASGAAYVFVEPAGGWVSGTETAKLTASDAASGDHFGAAVSVSGDTVVVGAPRDDDNGFRSGSAYVFVEPVGGWVSGTETTKITASDGAASDRYGFGVSVSGGTVVVGALGNDDTTGAAYVYEDLELADLSITKDDGQATAVPGSSLTYTVTASNPGPSDAPGATVADGFPPELSCTWTCAPSGGASCTAGPVAGDVDDTVDLPAGSAVTYTATCAIDPATTATLSNTASVTAPAGVIDSDPGNDSATDTTTVVSPADVSATKEASGQLLAGSRVVYTVILTNASAQAQLDNPGDELVDVLPAGLTLAGATADSGTVATAGDTVTWNGSIPGGGTVMITIEAVIDAGPGTVIPNQGQVFYDADGDGANESMRLTDDPALPGPGDPTELRVRSILEIPTLSQVGLALLVLALLAAALWSLGMRVA